MIYNYKGCQLAYNIAGDSTGFPVFINYGLVGDIQLENLHALASQNGLKIIVLERPGYGSSDFITMQNFDEWSEIVGSFLDFLNIHCFSVIGISAGAPYAYAIANKFPDTIKGVYIISGLPYILDEAVFEQYGKKAKFYQKIWNYSQEELEKEMYSILKKFNNFFFQLILPKSVKSEIKASLSNNCSGIAQSARLQMQDWGFDVYQISNNVDIWHAKNDKEVPFTAVKAMVNKMINAQLHSKGKSHIPNKDVIKAVLKKIKDDAL